MNSRFDQVMNGIATASAFLSGIVIVMMMLMITFDAIGRKFGYPVPGGLELSEAMMVATVYLALMAVQNHRENVFVSVATQQFSPRVQSVLDALASLLGLVLFAYFAWVAFGRAWSATLQGEFRIASIMVPIWPFRWFIPLGLALLCLQLLVDAVQDLRGSRPSSRREHLPQV
jgi:TRAP-type C4-dicarboxylate transport system permease small subunit